MLKYRAVAAGGNGVRRPPPWPRDCQNVIMADEMVPEAWFRQDVKSSDGNHYHLVTGFACARWRDAMVQRFGDDDDACCRAFDAQLRRVFAATAHAADVAPYCGGAVFDWSRDAPLVGMAYCSPSFDDNETASVAHYEALAAPELGVGRFWSARRCSRVARALSLSHTCDARRAGEHASWPRAPMTAHAALYSGQFSAEHALAFLKQKASPRAAAAKL